MSVYVLCMQCTFEAAHIPLAPMIKSSLSILKPNSASKACTSCVFMAGPIWSAARGWHHEQSAA